ncbi:major facilitator superfamily domain-containing protein [Suillus subaureus]|uniref:Major facilitator superfamily domain-containing protein n=1 Tax=Suillus subaureus TaxID=48587 RepID=A0A9P7JBB9_9AGAM|nr:major facilitator superfamily domain-containing protein [Suillus subaureus]KAG1812501.1 major facilitator superfamily domain-containing protein [Suillus subaureus]
MDSSLASKSPVISDCDVKVVIRRPTPSNARRYTLLLIFCITQFLYTLTNSALFSAIPFLVRKFGFTHSQSIWIISAYQLTFASFLLMSGKISDIYSPKYTFITGKFILGVISIGLGFVSNGILFLTLRALSGIAASLTIPSALALLVGLFPEPRHQAVAIAAFGAWGAIGIVLGLITGALFVEYVSWSWIFWFVSTVIIPTTLISAVLIPSQTKNVKSGCTKFRSLDITGISILTVAVILFIFAVTTGSITGWGSATTLAPLVIAIAMIAVFFFWEALQPIECAAVPSSTWSIPNFSVLFGTALLPYFWWANIFTTYVSLWQDVYKWSAMSSAVHMLPIGITAFVFSFTNRIKGLSGMSAKWPILCGALMMMSALVLFAFADRPDKYWPLVFPGFIIGSAGAMLANISANIAIFRATPPSMAGTVGAIFNCGLQLGSAVGLAAVSSIQASVQDRNGGPSNYEGQSAGFWFMLACISVAALAVLVFYHTDPAQNRVEGSVVCDGK